MKITLLQTGKTTEKYISEGADMYSERIRKYVPFEIITIPDLKNTRNMPVKDQKGREGKKINEFIKNDDYVVILDEKGREYSTREFSFVLERMLMLPKKRIVFLIGGAWGISEEVYKTADITVSLSRMTFSHQVVRLLFLEQLYRGFTIIKGEPYHHE